MSDDKRVLIPAVLRDAPWPTAIEPEVEIHPSLFILDGDGVEEIWSEAAKVAHIDPQAADFPPPELVEKVARSLCWLDLESKWTEAADDVKARYVDQHWSRFSGKARAAIAAFMEWAVGL